MSHYSKDENRNNQNYNKGEYRNAQSDLLGDKRQRPSPYIDSKSKDYSKEERDSPKMRKRDEKQEYKSQNQTTTNIHSDEKNDKQQKLQEGDFKNFPDITKKTVESLQNRNIVSLFPIQAQCFYPIFERKDIIGRDLTGSGKTLAFGLPLIEYFRKIGVLGSRKIQAIILAPTRELALQVAAEIQKLQHFEAEFKVLTVYGGVQIDDQIFQLKKGVDLFVGTTGRVLDHINRGNIDFSSIKSVVLDEADQMLKLGFKEDVEKILKIIKSQCTKDLQICLFSATVPDWIKSVASEHLKQNYQTIDLARDLRNKTAAKVSHLLLNCQQGNKISILADVLSVYGIDCKTIVFTQTKADANSLILSEKIKVEVEAMHGDITQHQREVTMKRFKEGKFNVLVATDVASRGLDIPNVDLIIQIEPPKEVETYIHRSGRTARAGKDGVCITFYTRQTQYMIQQIEQQAGIQFKQIDIPKPEDVLKASSMGIIKSLVKISPSIYNTYQDQAKKLYELCDKDYKKALCIALAYINGSKKQDGGDQEYSKSMLTGQIGFVSMALRILKATTTTQSNWSILRKYFPNQLLEQVKGMRYRQDMKGAVFDIPQDRFDRFMELFNQLKSSNSQLNFTIEKCIQIPDLLPESQSQREEEELDRKNANNIQMQQYGERGGNSRGNQYSNVQYSDSKNNRVNSLEQDQDESTCDKDQQPIVQVTYCNGNGNDKQLSQDSLKKSKKSPYGVPPEDESMGRSSSNLEQPSPTSSSSSPNKNPYSFTTSSKVLHMEKLCLDSTEEEIKKFFQDQNMNVIRVKLLFNKQTFSGEGYVEFKEATEADYAMNVLNGVQYDNKKTIMILSYSKFHYD